MTRLISGILLAAVALAAILFFPPVLLRVLAMVVAALGADEYLRVTDHRPTYARWIVIATVVYACWWMSRLEPFSDTTRDPGAFVLLVIVTAFCLGWVTLSVLASDRTIQGSATDLLAPVYVGLPLGMLVGVQVDAGWRATLLLLGTIVVSDSAQYYTGRAFGSRPLAPTISPKKTVEGAIGGVIFGVLFVIGASRFMLPGMSVSVGIILGAIVVALGIIGDLFESRLKRVAGVKDSSSLIPGHGGVLDRIDALLFATPAFYYALVRGYL